MSSLYNISSHSPAPISSAGEWISEPHSVSIFLDRMEEIGMMNKLENALYGSKRDLKEAKLIFDELIAEIEQAKGLNSQAKIKLQDMFRIWRLEALIKFDQIDEAVSEIYNWAQLKEANGSSGIEAALKGLHIERKNVLLGMVYLAKNDPLGKQYLHQAAKERDLVALALLRRRGETIPLSGPHDIPFSQPTSIAPWNKDYDEASSLFFQGQYEAAGRKLEEIFRKYPRPAPSPDGSVAVHLPTDRARLLQAYNWLMMGKDWEPFQRFDEILKPGYRNEEAFYGLALTRSWFNPFIAFTGEYESYYLDPFDKIFVRLLPAVITYNEAPYLWDG